jgi:hypothetical protein
MSDTPEPVSSAPNSEVSEIARRGWWSGRLLVYAIGLISAAMLDTTTPLGVADWLIELIVVWVAATWGGPLEMVLVAAAGTATMIAGLWSSPATLVPFWMGALNRLVTIGVMWAMVHVARARRIAEVGRAQAATEIRVLQGLLPICASCKCIRGSNGSWYSVESYLSSHSEAKLTHTYCPACIEKYFPEMKDIAEHR